MSVKDLSREAAAGGRYYLNDQPWKVAVRVRPGMRLVVTVHHPPLLAGAYSGADSTNPNPPICRLTMLDHARLSGRVGFYLEGRHE